MMMIKKKSQEEEMVLVQNLQTYSVQNLLSKQLILRTNAYTDRYSMIICQEKISLILNKLIQNKTILVLLFIQI